MFPRIFLEIFHDCGKGLQFVLYVWMNILKLIDTIACLTDVSASSIKVGRVNKSLKFKFILNAFSGSDDA